jgi:biopolymer transport protein ExbB
MIAIFCVGQAGWFLIFERWWHFRRQSCPVPRILENTGSDAEALAGRVLRDPRLRGTFAEMARGLAEARSQGKKAMVRRAREILNGSGSRLNRHLATIAVLATAAPLLGLAGTVNGIMDTFRVITSYGMGNPAMMAGGIAEALMVTEAGLVVAFPLLMLHNHLQNRADAIESECAAGATVLIRVFSSRERAAA